jgi:hypothetical protein
MTENQDPDRYRELVKIARHDIQERFRLYEKLEQGVTIPVPPPAVAAPVALVPATK